MPDALLFIGIAIVTGLTGGFWPPKTWCFQLIKPSWTPPAFVVILTWNLLYICLGLAAAGVSHRPDALILWGTFLLLHIAFTPVFMGRKDLKSALRIAQAMTVTATLMTLLFFSINTTSGLLTVPVALWCLIATKLAQDILQLNPQESR